MDAVYAVSSCWAKKQVWKKKIDFNIILFFSTEDSKIRKSVVSVLTLLKVYLEDFVAQQLKTT